MKTRRALLIGGLAAALLVAGAVILVLELDDTPADPDARPLVVVQRTGHPDELVFTLADVPRAQGDLVLRLVVENPAAPATSRILDTWNMTPGGNHVARTTGWPSILRVHALTEAGPQLNETRWIWIGRYVLADSPTLTDLAAAIQET